MDTTEVMENTLLVVEKSTVSLHVCVHPWTQCPFTAKQHSTVLG